jgi:hypothetical protein
MAYAGAVRWRVVLGQMMHGRNMLRQSWWTVPRHQARGDRPVREDSMCCGTWIVTACVGHKCSLALLL